MKNIDTALLLDRPEIMIDEDAAKVYFLNKTVLVTGASGSIGSELVRQLLRFNPKKIVLFCRNENNLFFLEKELNDILHETEIVIRQGSICDPDRVAAVFEESKPNIVYHAAANKHVPLSESNVSETLHNNVYGTKVVVDCAVRMNCESFVMISTDKAVNPTSIMGASKRIAELYVKHTANINSLKDKLTLFSIVRFGNVLGSSGSVVPIFQSQIEKGGPLRITHPDMTRFFMTIPEATRLVIQAGMFTDDLRCRTFILDMGEQVRIVDLAEKMIRMNGLEPYKDIDIVFSGIRPGEKIAEELSFGKEVSQSTQHGKIILLNDSTNTNALISKINDLFHFKADVDLMFLRDKISDIIPEAKVK